MFLNWRSNSEGQVLHTLGYSNPSVLDRAVRFNSEGPFQRFHRTVSPPPHNMCRATATDVFVWLFGTTATGPLVTKDTAMSSSSPPLSHDVHSRHYCQYIVYMHSCVLKIPLIIMLNQYYYAYGWSHKRLILFACLCVCVFISVSLF